MLGADLSATISKGVAALLRWLALVLVWPSREAAATALLLLWRRLHPHASPGDTAPWSELPPELLGLLLSRLPSQADRVRLRAVCSPWRSAPRPHKLPPPFPWIVLRDETFLTLPDGAPHRQPTRCCDDTLICVSVGSLLFRSHCDGSCCLVKPSSGEITPLNISLAGYSANGIHKLVLSDHIVAFLIKGKLTIIPRERRRGARHMEWAPPVTVNSFHAIADITVFQGKLYVLTRNHGPEQLELHRLDVNHEQNRIGSVQCISATPVNFVSSSSSATATTRLFYFYLVASGNRLLMVERQIDMDAAFFPLIHRMRPIQTWFKVSEAVDLIGDHGRWSELDTLMGSALFVGRQCSESLPAQCGAREDCVYCMTERDFLPRQGQGRKPTEDDLLGCVVYNVRDRTVEQLTWDKGAKRDGPCHPTWLFPADV